MRVKIPHFCRSGFSEKILESGPVLSSASSPECREGRRRGMGLDQNLDIPRFEFHFGSDRLRTISAEVFVFVSIGKDQKKSLPHRHGLAAARTKKGAGLKLFKGGLRLLRRNGWGGFIRFHELVWVRRGPPLDHRIAFPSLFISYLYHGFILTGNPFSVFFGFSLSGFGHIF